jgi:hypothetical protein
VPRRRPASHRGNVRRGGPCVVATPGLGAAGHHGSPFQQRRRPCASAARMLKKHCPAAAADRAGWGRPLRTTACDAAQLCRRRCAQKSGLEMSERGPGRLGEGAGAGQGRCN